MKPKSGFTVIEMLIVVIIIGVLMVILKNIFIPQDKDLLYAHNCTNTIYGEINNYINSAITSKGLYTGDTHIFPEYYNIDFLPNTNTINLGYTNQSNTNIYKTINLSGVIAQRIHCQSENYQVTMSGQIQNIQIKKGLQTNDNTPLFQLHTNGTQQFTGKITMSLCYYNSADCKIFSKYEIDTRTKHIKYKKCKIHTGNNDISCQKRN